MRSSARAARVCFTIRSSREWKVIATPVRHGERVHRGRQGPLEDAELVVDLDAQGLEGALGRVAAGAAGRGGDGSRTSSASARRGGEGLARRSRSMAAAIRQAKRSSP